MSLQWLQRTFELAQKKRGECAPNPAVGAVIVGTNGEVLGEGYHRGPFTAHAEVDAIQSAKGSVRGATMYVSLEPCCHQGRTGPCTEAIREAGIAEVIVGFKDPNPVVSGKGMQQLESWGIPCRFEPSEEANGFYRSYQYWTERKRPWVTLKLAMSLDGRIAGAGGRPVAITGEGLREVTHQRRDLSDAILTTSRTLNCDDPQMNVRLKDGVRKKRLYVLDSKGLLRGDLRVWESAEEIVAFIDSRTDGKELARLGARVVPVGSDGEGLKLDEVLDFVGSEGVHDLWVEAGGTLAQQLLNQGLAHSALFYVSPKWLGAEGVSAFTGAVPQLEKAHQVRWSTVDGEAICEMEW